MKALLEKYDLDSEIATLTAPENWLRAASQMPGKTVPFEDQLRIFQNCFEDWDKEKSPPPAWRPSEKELTNSNLAKWQQRFDLTSYQEAFQDSISNKERFWERVVSELGIPFKENFQAIAADIGNPENPGWLKGAQLNISDAALSSPASATAVVYQKLGSRELEKWTFQDLNNRVNQVAHSLKALNIKPASAIAIDMPMTVESVVLYLAIVKAGHTAVSIADSFATEEIATRLRLAQAELIFTQDVVYRGEKQLPMYDKVRDANPTTIIVLPAKENVAVELRDQDMAWSDFLQDSDDAFESVGCNADQPTNILFSSGTTGDPKAIPWDHVTPIKAAADGYFHHDIQSGDVVAWPTNLGWMMGPWLIYASLVNGATLALCDHPPMTEEFGRFVQEAKVTMLGLVPSIVKSWRSTGAMEPFDWSSIKCFSSTGEVSNPEDYLYLMSLANYRPVIEYCGGTEVGGGYVTGTLVQDASPSTFTTPAMGLDFHVIGENGVPENEGELFLEAPSMGLSHRLLNRDHHEVYFQDTPVIGGKKLRRHGDQIYRYSNGYYRAHGRADDTMNLGGIKTSSAELERACNATAGVTETAAIAVPPPGGGPDRLVVFSVGEQKDIDQLKVAFQSAIKTHLNPLFKVHDVVTIDKLPRTASNKVMRRVLRKDYAAKQ